MDKIDFKIIAALKIDGRITITELSDRVGISKTPCHARVAKLEKSGVIRGYAAIVDPVKLGQGHIAFVQVKLSDTRSKALDEFNSAALATSEIEQCHMIAGSFDYLLKVRTSDISSYREVLGEKLSALPHVMQTSTFVVMESVKDGH